jgi:hypothetical protein
LFDLSGEDDQDEKIDIAEYRKDSLFGKNYGPKRADFREERKKKLMKARMPERWEEISIDDFEAKMSQLWKKVEKGEDTSVCFVNLKLIAKFFEDIEGSIGDDDEMDDESKAELESYLKLQKIFFGYPIFQCLYNTITKENDSEVCRRFLSVIRLFLKLYKLQPLFNYDDKSSFVHGIFSIAWIESCCKSPENYARHFYTLNLAADVDHRVMLHYNWFELYNKMKPKLEVDIAESMLEVAWKLASKMYDKYNQNVYPQIIKEIDELNLKEKTEFLVSLREDVLTSMAKRKLALE